jgi:hypothetical protein
MKYKVPTAPSMCAGFHKMQKIRQRLIMKKTIVVIVTIIAFLAATWTSSAQETLAATNLPPIKVSTHFINVGAPLGTNEFAAYEQKTQQSRISHELAGEGESKTSDGVIILAVIGAIVIIGAIIYAANKNNEKTNNN